MTRLLTLLLLSSALAACATQGKPSGHLSSYHGLTPKEGALRTSIAQRRDDPGLAGVTRVAIEPARFADSGETRWLSPAERALLLREVDAQLCFELTERYELAPADQADARMRAIVTRVEPTGRAASALSAASGFFIPGPLGLRVPGTTGGLGAEAEVLDRDGRQVAAIVWNRNATPIGTDNPSLSRLGDALQFAEPFADAAAAAATPKGLKSRKIGDRDPCAAYGPRLRPEGFLARIATGLYVPQLSGAKAQAAAAADRDPADAP